MASDGCRPEEACMSVAHKPLPLDQDEEYEALLKRAEKFGIRKPNPVPPDQAWFWTEEWLKGTIEALEEGESGKTRDYFSDEELLASLEEQAADADPRREV